MRLKDRTYDCITSTPRYCAQQALRLTTFIYYPFFSNQEVFSILEAAITHEYLGTDLVLVRLMEQALSVKQEKAQQEKGFQHQERQQKQDLENAVQKEAQRQGKEQAEAQDRQGKEQKDESLEQEVALESEGTEIASELSGDGPEISYSFADEQFLMEQFYNSLQLDYESSWYKHSKSSLFESEEYLAADQEFYDSEAEILTTEEAEEALIEIQYAAVSGTPHEVDSETRRKFDMWIKFNPALFRLFEASYSLTRNVDYRPLA